ncbi:MAG: sulfotransferase [Gammaproteobacteria bacterium]
MANFDLPTSTTYLKNKAKQLLSANKIDDAQAVLEEIIEEQPGDAESWHLLGSINGQLGNIDQAEIDCRKAIACNDQFAPAHSTLGNILMLQHRYKEAEQSFLHALEIDPNLAETYSNLGNISLSLNHIQDAVQYYLTALAKNPELFVAYSNLGAAYTKLGALIKAEEALRQAITLMPTHAESYYRLGTICDTQGNLSDAAKYYQKCISINPKFIKAYCAQARVLIANGDQENAYKTVQPIIEAGIESLELVITLSLFSDKMDCQEQAIIMAKNLLKNKTCESNNSITTMLHFKLGDLYDKRKNFDQAFHHFEIANQSSGITYDINRVIAYFDLLKKKFTRDFLRQTPRSTVNAQQPVFIVGMPRSGTTLVEHILASHPEVFGADELDNISRLVDKLPVLLQSSDNYPDCLNKLTATACNELANEYLDDINALTEKPATRITDKMPQNFYHLGLISLLFPNAHIIHCKRNPLDNCLSYYFHHFVSGAHAHGYSYNLTTLGQYYKQYESLMEHWKKVLPVRLFEINYEDLINNQKELSHGLIDFIGLPWDERCLKFYKSERLAKTASRDQVNQPVYSKSIDRWKNYEQHIQPLLDELA